ncbi:nucleotide-binding alpha-beta plait domain, Zinc finger, RING/FYVE/PHD-type [Artemisia annua]|uniref:Nucleotide-binding alpha-beta plait domain, Zinc finger, RING/FYVE/PHD-type n=1 Tax=Artemisia annua TaxID=35608 RepID=A0A2U1KTB8_ARTAN|nr:nucleotide-binding alpha-beta plait domain, Zinc finger, RING/FYVE/PHD-type [Artemisia annua]
MLRLTVFIVFICLIASSCESFYLPGVAPRDFQRGDPLQVKVNKLSSTKTQLPYDYYYLNYCKPKHIQNSAENLGEVLRGDRIENSVYTFHMREELPCKVGCRVKLDAQSAKNFKEKIDDEYRVNMILDNLPVSVLRQRRDGSQSTTYEHGRERCNRGTVFSMVAANSSSRKQKQPKLKQKTNEGRKDLSSVRVIQRKMAYIIGLPLSLADEDLLQRKDYFGQYGKVTKISLSRTAGGTLQSFVNDTCSVYITYSKEEEAVRCIQSVHGYVLDGRYLRQPCNNVACLYLHSIGAEEDSFGKDEIAAVHTRNRVQEIVAAAQYLHKRSGSMLPSPVDDHLNSRSASLFEEPVFSSGLKDVAYAAVASGDHKNGIVKSSKHTTFVDIVGRSCNSGSGSGVDVNSVTEGQMLNLIHQLYCNLAQIGGDSNEYTDADFDDIREEWAIYVSNFIFR